MNTNPIELIKHKFLESQRIAITSHLRPDGDSICTSLALFFMGILLGKEMAIINKDETPLPFKDFRDVEHIKIGQIPAGYYDAVILLECANVLRSGQEGIGNDYKINIDHHFSNDFYADINWVEPEASAVGSMAFQLGEKLKIAFTPQMANHLYCAIVSDTGSFQFSNTRAHSFEVCFKLIELGANPIFVSEQLFHNNPPEKIKLQGQVLSTLRLNDQGNIATITMFKKNLDDLNLHEIETEDITTQARSIKGVQMVLFFKEVKNNTFRISIRSKGDANAALVAEHFGGGGHKHAAGFTVEGPYEKLLIEIPKTVNDLLKQNSKKA